MATVITLLPGVEPPESSEDEGWMWVEADTNGLFYGTGGSQKRDGAGVFYASMPEHDVSLERAVSAACEWADAHGVEIVYVQPAAS